jgi:D-lactate dehydrogenase (cytochrome)
VIVNAWTEPTPSAAVDRVLTALAPRFGERLTVNRSIREIHASGEGFHTARPPHAVAFPLSTEEVALAVTACADHGVPVIPFGAGTSLEGGVTAPLGGLCLDLSRMDAITAVNAADLDCTVQAGVTREALNAHLRDTGLFFPIDPGANATLGGMCATRASGTTAVRYGTMRDNVLSLEVVLADGSVIRTGTRARKSAAGYDLTRLFLGSEGTLGIITAVTLKLYGRPEAEAAAVCAFDTLRGAVDCVIDVLQLGVPVARIELMDATQVRACNAYSGTTLAETPTLLFEFHGSNTAVHEQAETVGELIASHGGTDFAWAAGLEDRNALWKARHAAYHAAQALRPGTSLLVTDVCVPISRLADCILETHADIAAAGLVAPIVGHVGDGNFHVMFPVDPDNEAEIEQVHALNDRLVDRALAMEGTCTGEHGVGIGKREKLVKELGPRAVGVMAAIKNAMDPAGILNPGKIFVPELAPPLPVLT